MLSTLVAGLKCFFLYLQGLLTRVYHQIFCIRHNIKLLKTLLKSDVFKLYKSDDFDSYLKAVLTFLTEFNRKRLWLN